MHGVLCVRLLFRDFKMKTPGASGIGSFVVYHQYFATQKKPRRLRSAALRFGAE